MLWSATSKVGKHGDIHSSNTNPACSSRNAGRISGTNLIVTTMKLPCDTEKRIQVHFKLFYIVTKLGQN